MFQVKLVFLFLGGRVFELYLQTPGCLWVVKLWISDFVFVARFGCCTKILATTLPDSGSADLFCQNPLARSQVKWTRHLHPPRRVIISIFTPLGSWRQLGRPQVRQPRKFEFKPSSFFFWGGGEGQVVCFLMAHVFFLDIGWRIHRSKLLFFSEFDGVSFLVWFFGRVSSHTFFLSFWSL